MPGNHEWRVAVGTKQRGPFSLEQMRETVAQGRMPADALVWRPGMAEWKPWTQVAELGGMTPQRPRTESPVMPLEPVEEPRSAHVPDESWDARPAVVPSLMDYVTFRAMITPILIQILFWIGVVLFVLAGLYGMAQGFRTGDPAAMAAGLFVLIIGPIYWRVVAELIIVFFRILDMAREINRKLDRR